MLSDHWPKLPPEIGVPIRYQPLPVPEIYRCEVTLPLIDAPAGMAATEAVPVAVDAKINWPAGLTTMLDVPLDRVTVPATLVAPVRVTLPDAAGFVTVRLFTVCVPATVCAAEPLKTMFPFPAILPWVTLPQIEYVAPEFTVIVEPPAIEMFPAP